MARDYEDKEQASPKPMTADEAYERITRLCARREYCTADVERKLWDYRLEKSLWAEVLDRLRERDFLNDERFAKLYARDKHEYNGWGRYRIQQELRARRISSSLIEQALAELYEEYQEDEKLIRLLEGKLRSIKADEEPRKRYDKLVRFGMYRGFSYDSIKKALRKLSLDGSDD